MKYLKYFEGLQRGNLYHIFNLSKCLYILETNSLSSYKFANISTTRNKNMNSYLGDNSVSIFKLELDGDKLSNKYKIVPFAYQSTEIDSSYRKKIYLKEFEEVIKTNKIQNINKYTNKFIIIKDKVERLKDSGWFNTDGGFLKNGRSTLPDFFKTYIPKINKLFGDVWVQDKFSIKKDNEWVDSIINYPVKKIHHAYGLYYRGYKPSKQKYGGLIDCVLPDDERNKEIEDLVIGYEYENLFLSKRKLEYKYKENFQTYIFDFTYEQQDIIKENDYEVNITKGYLKNIKPIR